MEPSHTKTALSLRALLLRTFATTVMRAALDKSPTPASRRGLERLGKLLWMPRGTRLRQGTLGGVPTEWVDSSAAPARGYMLYMHGGGYVTGSPRTHRGLTARLARSAAVTVVVPDYRLAPEHPHPAAVDDALAAYQALLEQGIPAAQMLVAGDSAGGGLSLALALRIRAAGLPQPAGLVLLSPFVDMRLSGDSMRNPAQKEWLLSQRFIQAAARHYIGDQNPDQITASPLFAPLQGLPPLFIQVGTDEVLLDDATRLAQAASQQSVPVTLQVWPRLWHVWQLHGGQMPEADRAIAGIADFIRKRLEA